MMIPSDLVLRRRQNPWGPFSSRPLLFHDPHLLLTTDSFSPSFLRGGGHSSRVVFLDSDRRRLPGSISEVYLRGPDPRSRRIFVSGDPIPHPSPVLGTDIDGGLGGVWPTWFVPDPSRWGSRNLNGHRAGPSSVSPKSVVGYRGNITDLTYTNIRVFISSI